MERPFWPITVHTIAIGYLNPDIGPYRVAIYVWISAFSGCQASGYRTLTVVYEQPLDLLKKSKDYT
jgi:hypothetical protein